MSNQDYQIVTFEEFKEQFSQLTVAELYSGNGFVRAVVQMIPNLGPIIDAFLAMPGTKFKEERLLLFLFSLHCGINLLDGRLKHLEETSGEDFHDIAWAAIESSRNTSSKQKIIANSMILTNLLSIDNDGGFRPEDFIRMLAELSPIEVKIIGIFYREYSRDQSFEDSEMKIKNALERAWKLKVHEKIIHELRMEGEEDLYYVLKRIERTGLISEITGNFYYYTGGSYMPTKALNKLMEYLNKHPFKDFRFDLE